LTEDHKQYITAAGKASVRALSGVPQSNHGQHSSAGASAVAAQGVCCRGAPSMRCRGAELPLPRRSLRGTGTCRHRAAGKASVRALSGVPQSNHGQHSSAGASAVAAQGVCCRGAPSMRCRGAELLLSWRAESKARRLCGYAAPPFSFAQWFWKEDDQCMHTFEMAANRVVSSALHVARCRGCRNPTTDNIHQRVRALSRRRASAVVARRVCAVAAQSFCCRGAPSETARRE
jgi:hypothetical protein